LGGCYGRKLLLGGESEDNSETGTRRPPSCFWASLGRVIQNIQYTSTPVADIWPFAYVGAYGTPIWGKGRS